MAERSKLTCGRLPSGNSPGRKSLTSTPLKWGLKRTQNASREIAKFTWPTRPNPMTPSASSASAVWQACSGTLLQKPHRAAFPCWHCVLKPCPKVPSVWPKCSSIRPKMWPKCGQVPLNFSQIFVPGAAARSLCAPSHRTDPQRRWVVRPPGGRPRRRDRARWAPCCNTARKM